MPASSVGVIAGADLGLVARHRAIWASLPLSLVEDTDPQLVAVDGATPSWPSDVLGAVASGARGVVVVEPTGQTSADEVRRAAASSDVAITVHREWANHPAVADLVSSAVGFPAVVALADSVVTVPDAADWRSVLGAQLAVLRALGVTMTAIDFAACDNGYTVHGQHAGTAVALAAWRSAVDVPVVCTALYGADGDLHLDLSATVDATPAQAWRVDANGWSARPTWYESAGRASWRRLRDAVHHGERPPDLAALADDLETVKHIVEQW